MNTSSIKETIDRDREKEKGAQGPMDSQSSPAIIPAGREIKPVIIWKAPMVLALYLVGDNSEMKVFCTGSRAALYNP